MTEPPCGCHEDRAAIPASSPNPPNQDIVRRRVGTHASFLAGMTTRLAAEPGVARLTARDPSDPAVAILDAWAMVADVLTFYQERFANEAYLRTATERRSVAELARLVGYRLRNGVSSSVPLAFTLDPAVPTTRAVIPAGTAAQSLPKPGEQPQTFETADALAARTEWNLLPVRQSRPQEHKRAELEKGGFIYLKGVATNLKPGDPLLIEIPKERALFVRAGRVEPDPVADRTRVTIPPSRRVRMERPPPAEVFPLKEPQLLSLLLDARGREARNVRTARTAPQAHLKDVLQGDRELLRRVVSFTRPDLREAFQQALRNQPAAPTRMKVSALRLTAKPFGHNAGPRQKFVRADDDDATLVAQPHPWPYEREDKEEKEVLWLDVAEAPIQVNEPVVIADGSNEPEILHVKEFGPAPREAYNLSSQTTKLVLNDGWATRYLAEEFTTGLARLKRITVYASPEELPLAEAPIPDDEKNLIQDKYLELQRYVPDLEPGRLLIFEGERGDLGDIRGVRATEVARIKLVQQVEPDQQIDASGGKVDAPAGQSIGWRYTRIELESPLAYKYRRSTVQVYGNVVWATHGETRDEVFGNGDAAKPWLSFSLRQGPVTHLPAPTPVGSTSTLEVRVDRVLWHEAARLREAGPTDRVYVAETDDSGRSSITFGDGRFGARPPSGVENVRGHFRVGTGTAGNVQAGQVSLLAQPPAGVQGVVNPLAAEGGADAEGTDRARRNAPLGTLTLGRVVSVRDYAAFARTFAGIGKAESALLTLRQRQLIHLTVAGSDDLQLPADSDLIVNLTQALARHGTARLPFRIDPRERVFVFLRAGVRLHPDYQWEAVHPELRQALVREFPFEHRGLGRHLFLSEVVAVLQRVNGVEAVEVDYFFGVEEAKNDGRGRMTKTPEELQLEVEGILAAAVGEKATETGNRQPRPRIVARPASVEGDTVRPAQIAYFGPETLDDLKAAVSFRLVRS